MTRFANALIIFSFGGGNGGNKEEHVRYPQGSQLVTGYHVHYLKAVQALQCMV